MPGTKLTHRFSATSTFNKGLFRPVLLAQKYMVMSLEKHNHRWISRSESEGKGVQRKNIPGRMGKRVQGGTISEETASLVGYLFKARWYKGMTLGN